MMEAIAPDSCCTFTKRVCLVPQLRPLVYPLVQVLLGAARLVPAPRYFPLRLRLVRLHPPGV